MARKKKSWFDFVKRFFRLDARSRAEKKERRRRWAFEKLQNKRLPPPITGPPQRAVLSEAEEVQSKSALNVAIATAAAAEAAMAAAQIAAEVFKLSTGVLVPQSITTADQHKQEKDESFAIRVDRKESGQGNAQSLAAHQCEMKIRELEDLKIKAAIKIQAAFRGYLARKALRALKGIVKLQAIIRGRAVRRQAITTLQRLQSIVNIHSQVCATRSHVGERTGGYNENSHIRQWRDRIKVEKNNPRRWDDSLMSKDKEEAFVSSKKEAAIKRERIKEYSYNHRRSAESENRKPNGRWRYWLEQWVDTQLNKSREYEDLDPVPSPTPKSKEDNGRRQLKPGSYLKQQQQGNPFEQSGSPVSVPKRQIRHKKQCSMGDDTFPSSPSIPTYMAATESARAKVRSLSSPKLRPGAFDTYSDSYSPYKSKLSLVSSVISEVPTLNCSYKGGKLSGQQQRSPSLKGLPCAVKSGRVTKDLNLE
ncbi:protein IQ-DOMAIN 31 [Punica granatum]|uniref:Protein IQ-DOMAIN 31 n=1 Tax=Punica granatum TaxID=22663 RepID=A0A218Y0F1_PUNGR|nr:protein IQ-DOMAIN 31 [Punica granatum]XP_031373796.1 protein IQ-DOMAIN 31 [Punica granatum]XP_031373797.1 protein IQ-DOMAIN 31 [Punica granatum]XP_031373798.1 protein IQ-DOMAIN 31 [Punica granatum]XP_031373799.1 protein IQ-DOMAIN 31 [Punica granatum]XP_031373800.1 protein IQ-DOMAIN 31 [Punica granatum]OWM90032.1 hypothetical protein CDL15_Pgr026945 [Punica granatum]